MDAKVYHAALEGSWEKLNGEPWLDQATPLGNSVLHVHVGRPLLKKGRVANINIEFIKSVFKHIQKDKRNLLLWHENANEDIPLHLAARFGHVKAVEELFRQAKSLNEGEVQVRSMLEKKNMKHDTALHEAARGGYGQVVALLIQEHQKCVYGPNLAKETPLYLAAESGIAACVVAILDNPALSNPMYNRKGPCDRTALHALVQWKDSEMLKRLLDDHESLIILKDDEGSTSLQNHESLIMLKDDEGSTPLHLVAADKSKGKHLDILLMKEKTNQSGAYIKDNEGRTPLHIATLNHNWDSIKKLIAHRPDCIEIVDKNKQNVLHYAANWSCIKNLEYFLELEDVDHLSKLMNDKDKDGNTPLHVVAANMSYITCGCINRVPNFMKGQQYAKSFNDQNLTAWDVIESQKLEYRPILSRRTNKLISSCGQITRTMKTKDARATTTEEFLLEKHAAIMKEGAQSQLVVAALVAAMSYTAGFTVPGGLNQELASPGIGTAVLAKRIAFKAFLISNGLALATSCLAVFFYFLCATLNKAWYLMTILPCAAFLTLFSVSAMLVSFLTGVHVVLPAPHFSLVVLVYPFLFYYTFQLILSLSILTTLMIRGSCPGPRKYLRLSWSQLL